MTEIVDGTAVEVRQAPAPAAAGASTAIARRERRSEVMRSLPADELVESFKAYQQLLHDILDPSDWQDAGSDGRFAKKSAWRKIATAFDLDVTIVGEEVERDHDGKILRAKVIARATAPSGRAMDGDGYCTRDEFHGKRGKNPKLENDLRATATTRAKNRAISDLVGMGEISAEEVAEGDNISAPHWAREATADRLEIARAALAYLIDPTGTDPAIEAGGGARALAVHVTKLISDELDVFPEAVAVAFSYAGRRVRDALQAPQTRPETTS